MAEAARPSSTNPPGTFGTTLQRCLKEVEKTPEELAASVDLPVDYINALIDNTIRPPRSTRSDIYDRMTKFLRLARKELAIQADAERAGEVAQAPPAAVARALLAFCEPETAAVLKERGKKSRLTDAIQRLLDLIQASVCRLLEDPVSLRVTASRRGISFPEQRVLILTFLDKSANTLTMADVAEFIEPRLERWDMDLSTGVFRIVMRTQQPRDRHRRQPSVRRT